MAGGSAVAAGVTTVFSSAAAISTIFGVGGAGLASYKMHRRTKGLTEFDFQKEGMSTSNEAELFSTICISGWLRDSRDFQRPVSMRPYQEEKIVKYISASYVNYKDSYNPPQSFIFLVGGFSVPPSYCGQARASREVLLYSQS